MKELRLLGLLIFLAGLLQAQTEVPRRFTWGGWLAYESNQLAGKTYDEAKPSEVNWPGPGLLRGMGGGAFVRRQLTTGIAFQPEISLAYTHQRFHFQSNGEAPRPADYAFADVELPIHFVFTNPPGRLPLRGSFLLGGRLSWNFAQNDVGLPFHLLRERLGLDIGLGILVDVKRWRLQPEMVWSRGLNNILQVESSTLVGRLERDRLTLRLLVWREKPPRRRD